MADEMDIVENGGIQEPECGAIREFFNMCSVGEVPLGDGLVNDAKNAIMSREDRLEDAINRSLGTAPPPKM